VADQTEGAESECVGKRERIEGDLVDDRRQFHRVDIFEWQDVTPPHWERTATRAAGFRWCCASPTRPN
jgi:hypothetical protein